MEVGKRPMRQIFEPLIRALSSGDIREAEKICEEVLSRRDLSMEDELETKERLAEIKLKMGDYKSASAILDKLMKAANGIGDRSQVARCHLNLGTIRLRMGRYQLAEEHYRAATHIFRWETEDKSWLGRCYNNLGILYKARGDWTGAMESFSLAMAVSSDSGDAESTCAMLLNQCIVARKIGLLGSAWESCRKAMTIARREGVHLAVCRCSLEAANICTLRGEIERATRYVARALALARKCSYRRELIIGVELTGDIALAKGKLAEAMTRYEEAFSTATSIAERSDLVSEVARRVAWVAMKQGKIDLALSYAEDAVAVARAIGDKWESGVSLRVLGEVRKAKGEIGLSIEALEESISVLQALSDQNYELGMTEYRLGETLLRRGVVGDVSAGRDHFLRARQIFGYLGWSDKVSEVDRLLGEIEKDHGLFIGKATETRYGQREGLAGKYGVDLFSYGIVTCDERIVGDLARWGSTEVRILIEGETGVGKELVARALHAMGRRREGPFVAVDCGGLSESLAESELFGHVRGAFTGASRDRTGLIEEADGGTLFLDEVGELSEALQVKLLRVLEEGVVRRVGENACRPVDVRVISATTRDLWAEVEAGRFRRELYYRLKGVLIRVPSLRERPYDIELLLDHYIDICSERQGKRVEFTDAARKTLLGYEWPGNVRELRNLVEALVLSSSDEGMIEPAHVEQFLVSSDSQLGLRGRVTDVERCEIEKALEATGGNKTRAARMLGISRRTLYRKLWSS